MLNIILMDETHIIAMCLGVLVIFLLILSLLLIKKKRKTKTLKIDDEFIDLLIKNYGGINNIKNVEVENSRLKITIADLDLVDLEELKNQAESGVFITGDIIKTLFKLSSDEIKKSLDEKLKES